MSRKQETNPETSVLIQAEKAALKLIARAEQCSSGLSYKLERRGFDSKSINEVISKLTELKLIDDLRFARLWLGLKIQLACTSHARSPRRILASLQNRGIDHKTAETAFKEILDEDTEFAILELFMKKQKKAARFAATRTSELFGLKHFLKSEGFSRVVIEKYLEG